MEEVDRKMGVISPYKLAFGFYASSMLACAFGAGFRLAVAVGAVGAALSLLVE